MPTITLSDPYEAKLKALVTEPFEQTRESIIEELIDAEVARQGVSPNGNGRAVVAPPAADDPLRINPDTHESLAFTRVLSATVDGRPIHRPKWNKIMDQLHVLGHKWLEFEALQRASGARLRKGQYEEEGFKYLPDADLSIQGVDSNLAWNHSLRLARALNAAINVSFEWRDKGAHPGERGVLEWNPSD